VAFSQRGKGGRRALLRLELLFLAALAERLRTAHVTYFQARPEQTLRRIVTKVDSDLRTALRKIKKSGFSKKDLYESEPNSEK
jgi:hypothetical protein